MSESPTTCRSCGAPLTESASHCGECGARLTGDFPVALFSMSGAKPAEDAGEFADVPTDVGPYTPQAMGDFAEAPDTVVASRPFVLYSIKRAYGPGEVVRLLAYDPEAAGRSTEVVLLVGGNEVARTATTLNEAGAGMVDIADMPPGVIEARLVSANEQASDRFIVFDAWPDGLGAGITAARITGNPGQPWLQLSLQLGVSGRPYDGTVVLELLDRDTVVSYQTVRVVRGEAHCVLAAKGHSPHSLQVSAVERDETIAVPLEWSIRPVELTHPGTALSMYPIDGAWHRESVYVVTGTRDNAPELPDFGNQLAPTIAAQPHCTRGDQVRATIDAGVGAPAYAMVVVRSARARTLHSPGRAIAAHAVAQFEPAAPPLGLSVSSPPFERESVVYSELHATDSSGRLVVDIPTDQPGDWLIDTFVMTDLGWGEAEARLRIE